MYYSAIESLLIVYCQQADWCFVSIGTWFFALQQTGRTALVLVLFNLQILVLGWIQSDHVNSRHQAFPLDDGKTDQKNTQIIICVCNIYIYIYITFAGICMHPAWRWNFLSIVLSLEGNHAWLKQVKKTTISSFLDNFSFVRHSAWFSALDSPVVCLSFPCH